MKYFLMATPLFEPTQDEKRIDVECQGDEVPSVVSHIVARNLWLCSIATEQIGIMVTTSLGNHRTFVSGCTWHSKLAAGTPTSILFQISQTRGRILSLFESGFLITGFSGVDTNRFPPSCPPFLTLACPGEASFESFYCVAIFPFEHAVSQIFTADWLQASA